MKISRFLSIGLSVSCLPFVAFQNTSCAKQWADDQTENDYTNYIKDRTFSIAGGSASGTAWILKDHTPDVKNDYNYSICTNMHVAKKIAESGGASSLKYADYSLANTEGYVPSSSYISFLSCDLKQDISTDEQYKYDDGHSAYLVRSIDLAIFNVDFGSPSGEIKQKLDRLNTLSNINKFITINDNSEVHGKRKHIGGYPSYKINDVRLGSKWECHNIAGDELSYHSINTIYSNNQVGHPVGDPDKNQQGVTIKADGEKYYWYDVSPQYLSKQKRPMSYMNSGSSGSLIIDDDFNSIGIYWGGWEENGSFYPSYSLFNTQYKEFIK